MPTFPTPPTLMYSCAEALYISNATNLGVHRQKKAQQAVRRLGKRRKRGEIQKEEKEQTLNQHGVWSPWKWPITGTELHKSRNTYYSRSKAVLFFHLNMLDQPGITLHICGWGLQL